MALTTSRKQSIQSLNESHGKKIEILEIQNVSFKNLHFKNHHSKQKRRIFLSLKIQLNVDMQDVSRGDSVKTRPHPTQTRPD